MFAGATARATSVVRWIALASIVGVLSGLLSGAFIEALQWTTDTRTSNNWLVATVLPCLHLSVLLHTPQVVIPVFITHNA
jgi:H+/Cl- antiporter ClcA